MTDALLDYITDGALCEAHCYILGPVLKTKLKHYYCYLYHFLVMITNVDMVARGVKREPQLFLRLRLIFNYGKKLHQFSPEPQSFEFVDYRKHCLQVDCTCTDCMYCIGRNTILNQRRFSGEVAKISGLLCKTTAEEKYLLPDSSRAQA